MKLGNPIDRKGKLIPIVDDTYVGQPAVGFMVHLEDGIYAISDRDEAQKCDSVDEAVSWIRRRWRGR